MRTTSPFDIVTLDGTALVPVYRYGGLWSHMWIDEQDVALAYSRRWSALGGRYAYCAQGYFHRLILNLQPGDRVVHHLNEDSLDNRRQNLQVVADAIAHGALPHPRRDSISRRLYENIFALPPTERELLLERIAA